MTLGKDMELELRHFRLVDEIARSGSITKAAAALGVSQPALTAQLQRVEQAFGGALFRRDRTGVTLTALGEVVLTHARSALSVVDSLDRSTKQRAAASDPSVVRVGASPGPLTARMVELVPAALPGTTVDLQVSVQRARMIDLLADGRLELAVCLEVPGYELDLPEHLAKAVIVTEPMFVGVGERHPLAAREEVELTEVSRLRWYGEGEESDEHRFVAHIRDECVRAEVPLPEVHDLPAAIAGELVAQGDGVMMVFASAPLRGRPGVVSRPIAGAPIRVRHVLVWPTDSPLGASALLRLHQLAVATYWETVAPRQAVYARWLERNGRLPN